MNGGIGRIGLWGQASGFLWRGVGPGGCCPQQGMTAPPFSAILTVGGWGGAAPSQTSTPQVCRMASARSQRPLGAFGWAGQGIHERICSKWVVWQDQASCPFSGSRGSDTGKSQLPLWDRVSTLLAGSLALLSLHSSLLLELSPSPSPGPRCLLQEYKDRF